jgi:hypothetical protein
MAVVRLEANMIGMNGVTGMSGMTIVNNDGCECRWNRREVLICMNICGRNSE